MIQKINSSLRQVSRDLQRLRTLAIQREILLKELDAAEGELEFANLQLEKESLDIDRLSKPGIPKVWHFIRPQTKTRWKKEWEEYVEAKREAEVQHFIVDDLRMQIRQIEQEAAILGDPEKIHQELMVMKEAHLREIDHPEVEKLWEEENKIIQAESVLSELEEADQAIANALSQIKVLESELMRPLKSYTFSQWMNRYYELRIVHSARQLQHQMIEVRKEMKDVMGESFQLPPDIMYISRHLLKTMRKAYHAERQIRNAHVFIDQIRRKMLALRMKLVPLTENELRKIRLAKQRMQQIVENV
ncbi:MAG: hypothetical protein AAFU33_00460 [Bacteroidota bacterium]